MSELLIVDNYDSFTFNLVQMIGAMGAPVRVVRNDILDVEQLQKALPSAVVISPGPGRCEDAGNTVALVRALSGRLPILGVCLGHQAIGAAFGARIVSAPQLVHGKASVIRHDRSALFEGIPSPFVGTRYHSLAVDEPSLAGSGLCVTARTREGLLMAFSHECHPTFGVQFHPESVLTRYGARLVRNFLKLAGQCA